jgi:hypothetical protein
MGMKLSLSPQLHDLVHRWPSGVFNAGSILCRFASPLLPRIFGNLSLLLWSLFFPRPPQKSSIGIPSENLTYLIVGRGIL